MTRRQRGFTCVRPPDLPLTCNPWVEQGPLGLNPGLRTPQLPATHARAGTGHRALTWDYTINNTDLPWLSTYIVRPRVARQSSCRFWPSMWRSARSSAPPTPSKASTPGYAARSTPEGISPPNKPRPQMPLPRPHGPGPDRTRPRTLDHALESRPQRLRPRLRRTPVHRTQLTQPNPVTPKTWLCRTFGGDGVPEFQASRMRWRRSLKPARP